MLTKTMKRTYFIRTIQWLVFLLLVVCGPVGWIVAYLLWREWNQTPVPMPPPELYVAPKTDSKPKSKKKSGKRSKKHKHHR